MVSTTVYDDDDFDDADCDSGLAEGEVLDAVCCVLLAVSVLVPVLVFDGLMVSSTVEAFDRSFLWGEAKWSWGWGSAY